MRIAFLLSLFLVACEEPEEELPTIGAVEFAERFCTLRLWCEGDDQPDIIAQCTEDMFTVYEEELDCDYDGTRAATCIEELEHDPCSPAPPASCLLTYQSCTVEG